MTNRRTCGRCGIELDDSTAHGYCPSCLLRSGLEDRDQKAEEGGRKAEVGGQRFGNYELLEKIGQGGMGVVYRARQINLARIVAVKLLPFGRFNNAEAVQRFQAEASAAAGLQHPNIVAIHDVGEHEGQHFFSMDFVEGRTLAELVRDQPLPGKRAATYVKTIAEAVHYAHQHGILHRDLKPSNILIDASDQPRITDFGLAKRFGDSQLSTPDPQLTLTGQVIGSPNYLPPEQCGGKARSSRREKAPSEQSEIRNPKSEIEASLVTSAATRGRIGPWSDVYGLGAILYHLLTGRPPFQADSLTTLLKQVLETDPVAPRALNPSIPRDLETVCLKCLEKESHRRYPTAETVAEELDRFLEGKTIRARPVSLPEKSWRWCRRNSRLAGSLGAALLFLLIVAIGGPIAAIRINKSRKAEAQEKLRTLRHLYASDINLAQQALKLNNLGRARRLLDRHRPQLGEEDLRGWEWRYLWQLTRSSALGILTNRPTRGYSVSFSPDGTRLAVGWIDGRVDLWDVPGRRCVRALTDRDYLHPGRVAFSPVRNLLAATSKPRTVTLYDLDSGRESVLWQAPDSGAGDVRDLSFSQDGSKVVIYAGSPDPERFKTTSELSDAVWVVNVSSSTIEIRHPTLCSFGDLHGAARLSPDNRILYLARSDVLNYRYSIQCLNLTTGQELWQTEPERDLGLTALAISPDGRVLASGSGYEDPTIRVWDAATGKLLYRLDGHTSWVGKLAFAQDGRRLISAATDQSIRFWDTSTWTETKVLRGHTDEVRAVAISESAQLVASTGKDGNLMLWQADAKSAADGYRRLPEDLGANQVLPLDQSHVLLLPSGRPPELIDLKRDSAPVSLPELGSSTNVLGCLGTNLLCHWNGTNQILVRELRGAEFIRRAAITLDSGTRPTGFAYSVTRQLLAWTEGASSNSVYLESLTAPGRRVELQNDVPGLVTFRFSEDGKYLAAQTKGEDSLRAWNVETGQIVASTDELVRDAEFADGVPVLVVAIQQRNDHEIGFYDLAHPGQPPRRVPGRFQTSGVAVSPDGGLVAFSTNGGQVRLYDPAKGEWIADLHGHLNAAFGIAFSPDGQRLISASNARETVKLWDVGTRQELLTLSGTGSLLSVARWSADGDVILAGPPWQVWRAPSWEEIEAVEKAQVTP